MKKRNMTLPKRVLAMSLSLAMCAGMVCTTAFADDAEDYVYAYVGVDVVDTTPADDSGMPTFDKTNRPDDTALAEAEKALDQSKEALDAVKKPADFDADKALEKAVDQAAKEVAGRLETLETTPRPEYNGTAPAETEPADPADAEKSEFDIGAANDKIDSLNEAQADTDQTVSGAVKDSGEALKDLVEGKSDVDEELNGQRVELEIAKSTAERQVEEANQAVEDCKTKQAELKTELERQIGELKKPAETFRDRAEDESEADYAAAQNAWVKEYEDYNAEVAKIQEAYNTAAEELKTQSETAQQAVKDAQDSLKKAEDALTDYNASAAEKYGDLAETADAIKDHNGKLDGYNGNVGKYNEEAEDYNRVAGVYEEAVGNYNEAAGKYNNSDEVKTYDKAVDEYNGDVDKYQDAAEKYDNEAAQEYNQKVDDYNKQAGQWNSEKAQVDMLKSQLQEELNKLGTNITVDRATDILNTDTSKTLTDDQIKDYNDVVKAYNNAVDAHNKALTENKDTVIKSVVENYFSGSEIWKTDGVNGASDTHWYCLGKIDVKGTQFGGFASDFKNNAFNGDAYQWEKDSNGKVTGTMIDPSVQEHNSGWLEGTFDEFTGKLANGDKTFVADSKVKGDSEYEKLMTDGINKWVLTAAPGANDGSHGYYVDSNRTTWHLNGYLHVTQLNKLAALETHVKTVKEDVQKADKASVELKDDTSLTRAETYDRYAPTLEIDVTAPTEEWEKKPDRPDDFGGVVLGVTTPDPLNVPDRIVPPTPTPTPTPTPEPTPTPTPTPTPDPVVDIPDPDVPLAETPEEPVEEPVVEIPDEEVPLAETPEEVVIPDEDVPLAAVPQTGDISTAWYAAALTSACALAAVSLRKKEDED